MPGVPSSWTAPQEHLQRFIASAFYVRMVSLLDDALEKHIDSACLPLPRGYRGRLAEKIDLVDSEGALRNATELHRIRERRNQVAHQADAKADWQEVSADVAIIHQQLELLGLVGPFPHFETFGERAAEQSDDPTVVFVNRFTCGVRDGDKKVLEFSWAVAYHDE